MKLTSEEEDNGNIVEIERYDLRISLPNYRRFLGVATNEH